MAPSARPSRISGTERVVRCLNLVASFRPSGNSSPALCRSATWTGCRSQMERPVTEERSSGTVSPVDSRPISPNDAAIRNTL
jgi:hypothetical protein